MILAILDISFRQNDVQGQLLQMRIFLQTVLMDHVLQIVLPTNFFASSPNFLKIVIPDNKLDCKLLIQTNCRMDHFLHTVSHVIFFW